MFRSFMTLALLLALAPLLAQAAVSEPVIGDAAAGLVSRSAGGEVHLIADPKLNDRRASFRLVVFNRGAAPQPFGPDAVQIVADGRPVAVATRAALVGRTGGGGPLRDTSQGRVVAPMPVNNAGQTDVSGYTGGIGASTAGVPSDTLGRADRGGGEDAAFAAQLDAVLLKPVSVGPGKAEGGQLFTDKLKHKIKQMEVSVTFAGEVHRFRLDPPR